VLDITRNTDLWPSAVSVVSTLIILLLVVSEFGRYWSTEVKPELHVDINTSGTIEIFLNVTFPAINCEVLSIDAVDASGAQQVDLHHTIYKQRLDKYGVPVFRGDGLREHQLGGRDVDETVKTATEKRPDDYCGSCYGAEEFPTDCCNTCEQIREKYRKKAWALTNIQEVEQCVRDGFKDTFKNANEEGCTIHGSIVVNKVQGTFHIAPGKSYQHAHTHVHDFMPSETAHMDFSHVINALSFGKPYPGLMNPLDGYSRSFNKATKLQGSGASTVASPSDRAVPVEASSQDLVPASEGEGEEPKNDQRHASSGLFQYYLKIVPTEFVPRYGRSISTNQYSVASYFREVDASMGRNMPGVFFFYDINPISARYVEKSNSFTHFLTSVCAIVGGIFTVAGIIDSFIYQGQKTIKKKIQMGKLS